MILHHYDFSNFSEKVRLVLAYKNISWKSVIIPSHLPKPDYIPLTAGYRRTPALQIGADVYCDTRLIVSVLESIVPSPTLYPMATSGLDFATCKMIEDWAETNFIRPIALYVTGIHARQFPKDFHFDRADLHGKRRPSVEQVELSAARYRKQVEIYLDWLDQLLAGAGRYVLGEDISITDIVLYEGPWFLKKISRKEDFLKCRPALRGWFHKIERIKQSAVEEIDPSSAIRLAFESRPAEVIGSADALEDLKIGQLVKVSAIGQNVTATGELVHLDSETITISSKTALTGVIHVHFPRLGYSLRTI
ncbi:MAG: glutathione S-transferase family protein [Pseudomonadota bacterium]|nr:glutathione S-transferase family protein [Pseudomonadota bacterium]